MDICYPKLFAAQWRFLISFHKKELFVNRSHTFDITTGCQSETVDERVYRRDVIL